MKSASRGLFVLLALAPLCFANISRSAKKLPVQERPSGPCDPACSVSETCDEGRDPAACVECKNDDHCSGALVCRKTDGVCVDICVLLDGQDCVNDPSTCGQEFPGSCDCRTDSECDDVCQMGKCYPDLCAMLDGNAPDGSPCTPETCSQEMGGTCQCTTDSECTDVCSGGLCYPDLCEYLDGPACAAAAECGLDHDYTCQCTDDDDCGPEPAACQGGLCVADLCADLDGAHCHGDNAEACGLDIGGTCICEHDDDCGPEPAICNGGRCYPSVCWALDGPACTESRGTCGLDIPGTCPCEEDDDCGDGFCQEEVCYADLCDALEPECISGGCGLGNGTCACMTDDDCAGDGHICQDMRCYESVCAALDGLDCLDGSCNLDNGMCGCDDDDDCGDSNYCVSGFCWADLCAALGDDGSSCDPCNPQTECSNPSECDGLETCEGGQCVDACAGNPCGGDAGGSVCIHDGSNGIECGCVEDGDCDGDGTKTCDKNTGTCYDPCGTGGDKMCDNLPVPSTCMVVDNVRVCVCDLSGYDFPREDTQCNNRLWSDLDLGRTGGTRSSSLNRIPPQNFGTDAECKASCDDTANCNTWKWNPNVNGGICHMFEHASIPPKQGNGGGNTGGQLAQIWGITRCDTILPMKDEFYKEVDANGNIVRTVPNRGSGRGRRKRGGS